MNSFTCRIFLSIGFIICTLSNYGKSVNNNAYLTATVTNYSENFSGFVDATQDLQSTVINFNSLTEGEIISSQFENKNVIFSQADGLNLHASTNIFGPTHTSLAAQVEFSNVNPGIFSFSFVKPVRGISFTLYDQDHPITAEIFNDQNQLLDTFSLSNTRPHFIAFLSDSLAIGKITITGSLPDGLAFDDLNVIHESLNVGGSLIAHWTFDDETATDITGNGHQGTIFGAVSVPSRRGKALAFDGASTVTYVEVPDLADLRLTNTFTLEVIYQVDSDAIIASNWRDQGLVSKVAADQHGPDYALKVYQNGPDAPDNVPEKARFLIHSASSGGFEYEIDEIFSLGEWHHLAGVFNNGQVSLYLDYEPVGSFTVPENSIRTSNRPLRFGRGNSTFSGANHQKPFDGLIDEIAISNIALQSKNFVIQPGISFLAAKDGAIKLEPTFASPSLRRNLVDKPLVIRNTIDDLNNTDNFHPVQGLVADGVTPLVIKKSLNIGEYRIELTDDQGERLSFIENKLHIHDGIDDYSAVGVTNFAIESGQSLFAYIEGIKSQELIPILTARSDVELDVNVKIYRVVAGSNDDLATSKIFKLRNPPIALVHGYNSDKSAWYDDGEFDRATNSGDSEFIEKLEEIRTNDFIKAIEYGVDVSSSFEVEKIRNIAGTFRCLSTELDERLHDCLSEFQQNWAITRVDVVAHSQGGVLARMLSSEELFQSPISYYRGRFHTVTTIGAPHNGSLLAHYLIENRGAITGTIVRQRGLLQPKFNPFDEQIRNLNKSYKVHPRARFHLIRTLIGQNVSTPLIYFLAGLNSPVTFSKILQDIVIPNGADGIVDFESQGAGMQPPMVTTVGLTPIQNICHATPLWAFASVATQTTSTDVAGQVVRALTSLDTYYGTFIMPDWVPISVKEEIEDHLPTVAPTTASVASFAATSSASASESFEFFLTAPAAYPIDGDVAWYAELIGSDGVSNDGFTLQVDQSDTRKVTLIFDDTIEGDIALYGFYTSTTGELVKSQPIIAVSRSTATLTGVSFGFDSLILSQGSKIFFDLSGVYSDNSTRPLVDASPTVIASDPTILNVIDNTTIEALSTGVSQLNMTAGGFSISAQIRVNDPPTATISSTNSTENSAPVDIDVAVTTQDSDGSVTRVDLFLNGVVFDTKSTPPFDFQLSKIEAGNYDIHALAYDNDGETAKSANLRFTATNSIDSGSDSDQDGMNDSWETLHFDDLSQTYDGDFDQDGLTNDREFELELLPDEPDSDGDGLADGWEIDNFLDPKRIDALEDEDGDGISNMQEFLDGSDPQEYMLSLSVGWNLISLSTLPNVRNVHSILGEVLKGQVWVWKNNKFEPTNEFLPLYGHWVYAHESSEIEIILEK